MFKRSLGPNIREKRKVGNKFEKFSREELLNQIFNVLKPENEYVKDIDHFLLAVLGDNTKTDSDKDDIDMNVGNVALVEGPFREKRVGLVMSKDTIQLYHFTRYGFEPDDITADNSDWKVLTVIEDYYLINRRTGVYMRCSVSKKDLT